MCRHKEETVEHLFITCTHATKLWELTHDLGAYIVRKYNNMNEIGKASD